MAFIELNRNKLKHNFEYLNTLFKSNQIEWGVVSKLLCGNTKFLKELIDLEITEFYDSRISNLKALKSLNPGCQTVYIKPPAKRSIKSLVQYADVSFNTEFYTIKAISDEAHRQEKIHKIIIMIEMGDLREGVMGDDLIDFYSQVFELPNIEIIGLGTNLNCMNGVMPTQDKLIQLSLYEQLIEARFNRKIKWVTGGTSVTIPMLLKKLIPKGINHFRIGETLFLGNNLLTDEYIPEMKHDIFTLYAEIIELTEKPMIPNGEIGTNVEGESPEFDDSDYGKTSYRAILDVGLLDINTSHITPIDSGIILSGASSDMIVVDIGSRKGKYKVGDLVGFKLTYMGILSIMSSSYIGKVVV